MMNSPLATTEHLTNVSGVVNYVVWHTSRDIFAADMDDGTQQLFIDGKRIDLDPRTDLHASQMAINLCACDGRKINSVIRALKQKCAE